MYVYLSSITMDNNSFNNNEASNDGGVVYANHHSNITMENSSFSNNEVGNSGGVMYVYLSSITVDSSSFNNSEASNDGGVVYANYHSSITVEKSSFNSNGAEDSGGVMYSSLCSSIIVDNSLFNNNEASNDGGVVYASYHSNITVEKSSFNDNEADDNGGAMYAYSHSSIVLDSSCFNNNEAKNDGGVVYANHHSNITVENSSFNDNEADDTGGVMYAYSHSSIAVDSSSFNNNEAKDDGGVVYANYRSRITVENSSFSNSEAGDNAGVMSASYSSITIDSSSFNNNKANFSGGVLIAFDRSGITLSNSFFNNNEASNNGGVMYAEYSSSIIVSNSSFNKNEAGYDGGVMLAYDSNIIVDNCSFKNNEAGDNGGVVYAFYNSNVTIDNSFFNNNKAGDDGGVVRVYRHSNIIQNVCIFFNNTANEGGVVYVRDASFTDLGSMYSNNTANSNGGVISLKGGDIQVTASKFVNNSAGNSGGVLYTPVYWSNHHITFDGIFFHNNKAIINGGVIAMLANCFLIVTKSTFSYSNANRGGVIYLQRGNNLTITYSKFIHNSANSDGGVIYSDYQNCLTFDSNTLNFNRAKNNGGVFCSLIHTELNIVGENCTLIGNQAHKGGVAYASESRVNVYSEYLLMANNTAVDTGGTLCLSKANLTFFNGKSTLIGNQANVGGAIYASKSKILTKIHSLTNLNANSAIRNGGALYLSMSNLKVQGNSSYTGNKGTKKGGGLHAASSSIIIEGTLHFINNEAENGGGISLETNTKLRGTLSGNNAVNFVSNRASHYGGALYVNDETSPDMCAGVPTQNATSTTECFADVFINFSDNSAGVSGSNLFGGLLDRCTVHAEHSQGTQMDKSGVTNFQRLSNISESQLDTISSHPVRVCFCKDSQPDCDYQPVSIQVDRGKTFSIELIAYDQVNYTANATIHCSLNSSAGGLGEDQAIQHVSEACTELQFNLFSPLDSEDLLLSMSSPCNVTGITKRSITIEITCTCPIGFQISNNDKTTCDCVCDQVLQPYDKTECDITTESIIRKEPFWITYANLTNSSRYIIYSNCPFDYCHPSEEQISVNLNLPNGSDGQCASNRAGTLCGTCKPGLSVSLGSSHCLHCPTYWPGLLVTIIIVFILSGIGLVVLMLVLNLTVAVGTLNVIIFYANIVAANKSAFFPTSSMSFASVFISWLNFDFGFDTCFFDGMNMYIKTWLQLAFPAYIIFLVAVIIRLCHHFDGFGRLIGRKDPVATLATLILLSYTKLLQTIITAFSSATLNYPDNTKKSVWLPDATVGYLTSKHVALFIVAILILLIGLAYTLLLFSWQWFHCCPRNRVKWIRNQKLSSFLEVYHVPYTPKHRYWTGLLLFCRVSIYLVSALNPSGDLRIAISSTVFTVSCLLLYVAMFRVRIYRQCLINVMETFTYFNIIALSVFTLYSLETDKNQAAVTNISVGVTFAQLLVVICYHVYGHKVFSKIQETAIYKTFAEKLNPTIIKKHNNQPPPPDNDIHQFHELLNMIDQPVNSNDYNIPQVDLQPAEPTYSVVEVPKPHLAPPSPPPQLEEIREEPEPEAQQQLSEQDYIIVAEENQSAMIDENKKYLNNCFGIEISEYDGTTTSPGIRLEDSTTFEALKSTPKPHINPQIENDSAMDIQPGDEEMPEMFHGSGVHKPEEVVPHTANTVGMVKTHND